MRSAQDGEVSQLQRTAICGLERLGLRGWPMGGDGAGDLEPVLLRASTVLALVQRLMQLRRAARAVYHLEACPGGHGGRSSPHASEWCALYSQLGDQVREAISTGEAARTTGCGCVVELTGCACGAVQLRRSRRRAEPLEGSAEDVRREFPDATVIALEDDEPRDP